MFGIRMDVFAKVVPHRLCALCCVVLYWSLCSQNALAKPRFVDVTEAAGLTYTQHEPRRGENCIFTDAVGPFCEPERMSGGAAVGDIDQDGDLDLYVTRLDRPDLLFRNRGDGTFEDATAEAGLDQLNVQSNGALFSDLDNDGDQDLYVTVLGRAGDAPNNRHYLLINDGQGRFTEEAARRGAAVRSPREHRMYSASVGDYDRDGWLDIHTNEWTMKARSHTRLLRNLGPEAPGHFADVTRLAGVNLDGVWAFASTFTDLDDDGWLDLAVAADFGTSRLYWNNGDGTFRDGTAEAGVGTDENGMGSTFGDYDGDGDLDWFVTSIDDPVDTCQTEDCNWGISGNRLYRNEGERRFSDATDEAGVRNGFWGWGAAFFDCDNDGDLDLVMTNGARFPDHDMELAFNNDPIRLWENDGTGVMTEVSAEVGLTDTGSGKGLLVFDYDNDGDLDLFIVNNADVPRLYRNDGGNANQWLRVRAIGTTSNRDGIGVKVIVQTTLEAPAQVREIGTSTHFLGQSERVAHFGLGAHDAPLAKVSIAWPGGHMQVFQDLPTNSTITITEPLPPTIETP